METTNFLFFVGLIALAACSTSRPSEHRTLQATLWVQNAAEYDALTVQAYRAAQTHLKQALTDSAWTASIEQAEDRFAHLPAAVILDIDETVLDNSPFQARMIERNSDFDPVAWNEWVLEARAEAVPGAISFTRKADSLGIRVFYLSNRDAETEEATRKNLEELGFPVSGETDMVLLNGEQPGWTSAKTERRKSITGRYRVLMIFGDDLNDFISAKNISEAERDEIVQNYASFWSRKWFVLPNPVYGSWDQALFEFQSGLSEEEKKIIRRDKLRRN